MLDKSNDKMENYNREQGNIKDLEILKLKDSIAKSKISIGVFNSRLHGAQEKINKVKQVSQIESQKEKTKGEKCRKQCKRRVYNKRERERDGMCKWRPKRKGRKFGIINILKQNG